MAPSDYSDRQLEDALRKEVKSIIATGKLEGLTVNAVRSQAERALDLPGGYFKNDSKWKDRSKNVITKAANQEQDAASKTASASSAPPTSAKKQETQKTKRAAPTAKPKPAKRRKVSESPSSEEGEDMVADDPSSDITDEVSFKSRRISNIKAKPAAKDTKAPAKKQAHKAAKVTSSDQDSGKSDTEEALKPNGKKTAAPPKQTKRSSKAVVDSDDDDELSEPDAEPSPPAMKEIKSPSTANTKAQHDTSSALSEPDHDPSPPTNSANDQSESEMSVLIDDPPPPKRRKSTDKKPPKKSSAAVSKKTSTKTSTSSATDPQAQELKDLQSQLLKCGIRRIWSKELADFSSHKEKTRHLKKLLEDIGMKGRFSNAKAAEIKERRELLAEVEAAREFDEAFGESKEDDGQEEDESGTKSRRLKNRAGGSQMLADLGFAADSDSDD